MSFRFQPPHPHTHPHPQHFNLQFARNKVLEDIDQLTSKLSALKTFYENAPQEQIDPMLLTSLSNHLENVDPSFLYYIQRLPALRQPTPPRSQSRTFTSNTNGNRVEVITTITTTSNNDLPESLLDLVRDLIGSSPFPEEVIEEHQLQQDVVVGLDKTTIRKMKTKRIKSKSREINSEDGIDTCLVCLEEYKKRDKLRILPCKHEFHKKCIDRWFEAHVKCPICRQDVREDLRDL